MPTSLPIHSPSLTRIFSRLLEKVHCCLLNASHRHCRCLVPRPDRVRRDHQCGTRLEPERTGSPPRTPLLKLISSEIRVPGAMSEEVEI